MKRLLFTFLLGFGLCTIASAQKISIATQNAEAINNYDGTRGFFNYALSPVEQISINYSLAPKNPSSEIRFTLSTADPIHLKAVIKDASGKVVLNWASEQINNAYFLNWDISKFKTGIYTLDVYSRSDANSIQQLSFTKK